mgnify:FL=1
MSIQRDQLATSNTTSDSSTSERNYNYIQRKINEFKDGVTDGLIHGERDEKKSHHYYNQGYDFGLTLYGKLNQYLEDNDIRVSRNNEKE